jgi:hypothetical protein
MPNDTPERNETPAARPQERWEKLALLIFGAVFLVALMAMIGIVPNPSRQAWYVVLCILGLAAGTIAALLPGSVDWTIHAGFKVTGALAITVLIILVGKDYAPPPSDPTQQGRVTTSMSFERCTQAPRDISNTDVYLAVNGKIVWADIKNAGAPQFKPAAGSPVKCETPLRGSGGIFIECTPIEQKAILRLFVHGFFIPAEGGQKQEKWWSTLDLKAAAVDAKMDDSSIEDFQNMLHP